MTCLALAGKCGVRGNSGLPPAARRPAVGQQAAQRQRAEAHAAAGKQLAASERQVFERKWVSHWVPL